jgi:HPt (histidine-containing phosphotransfer) domain-containing protein
MVHQLAGSSANIHAVTLHELCLHLEESAPSAAAAELQRSVASIGAELARVSAALQQGSERITDVAQPAS